MKSEDKASICPQCGLAFSCGASTQQPCWCFDLPHVMGIESEQASCYCPSCLAEKIKAKNEAKLPDA